MELDDGPISAQAAAARASLAHLATGNAVNEQRMSAIARTALFDEAMLAALHARLNELRTVAK